MSQSQTTSLFEQWYAGRAKDAPPAFGMSAPRNVIPFTYGLPDEDSFPVDDLIAATETAMHSAGKAMLQYGHPAPLANFIISEFAREEGLELEPKNVLITAGSAQMLGLACRVFIEPGDVVLVEAPTFLGAVRTFRSYEADVIGVPLDENGVRTDVLAATIADIKAAGKTLKFFYTIPTFHNPTGTTLPLERRHEILRLADEHNFLVVEDDAYHGLVFEDDVPPTLLALDRQDGRDGRRVIYAGTFSKRLAAGMRLGYGVAHPEIIGRLGTLKDDGGTSPFSGYVAAEFAKDGRFGRHVADLNDIYRRKRDRVLAGLERYMPDGSRWTTPHGGFFVWLELPEGFDSVTMLPEAITQGVNYLPGPACFADARGRNCIRLAFSFVKLEQIDPGLRILGDLITAHSA